MVLMLSSMFSALNFFQSRYDDNHIDRLSSFYTSTFLTMMAVLVSFKQFGGRPLECWMPAHFTHSWEAYTEMYCWAQNTYWLPMDEQIPNELDFRLETEISYYQWVPFLLLIQAFIFYGPCMIWRLLNGMSGIRLHDLILMVQERNVIEPEVRSRTIASVAKHLERVLRYQKLARTGNTYTMHRVLRCLNLRYYEAYVTGLYLVVKVIYAVNVFLNLMLMNKFLETDRYSVYGVGVLKDLFNRRSWHDSGNFPRVTLCDFEIRTLGLVHRYTVQCVLVINIFTEKLFILLWLWFTLLFVATICDMVYWLSVSITYSARMRFVVRHLEMGEDGCEFIKDFEQIDRFVRTYVKVDGVFVLQMVCVHAGVMMCTELTRALWKRFLVHQENQDDGEERSSKMPRMRPPTAKLSGAIAHHLVMAFARIKQQQDLNPADAIVEHNNGDSLVANIAPVHDKSSPRQVTFGRRPNAFSAAAAATTDAATEM